MQKHFGKSTLQTCTGSGYNNKGEVFAEAICKFAVVYSDQTARDYKNFIKAIKCSKLAMDKEF
ncbi:MAG: DUF2252 family protein [Parafilimonas sp.]|nr:DUF2252 family protein [Parafilimonas sp.]